MAAPKRNKTEREKDLTLTARLYLEGNEQWQIVEAINKLRKYKLSQQMISYDLIDIRKRWMKSALRDFDEAKAQELSKIDNLETMYHEGYKESGIMALKKEKGEKKGKAVACKKDARFLDGVLKCVSKRCEILGTDAPKQLKVDVENPIHVYLPDNKRGKG